MRPPFGQPGSKPAPKKSSKRGKPPKFQAAPRGPGGFGVKSAPFVK